MDNKWTRYLGSLISEDGYCTIEIRSTIEMSSSTYGENKLFTGKINVEAWN